jgi:hypothetical protein
MVSAEARCIVSSEANPEGTNDAPAFQRGAQGGPLPPVSAASRQSFRRRDRWGKLERIDTCAVCGRRLWVNWTRARPCLFCDDAAREAKR